MDIQMPLLVPPAGLYPIEMPKVVKGLVHLYNPTTYISENVSLMASDEENQKQDNLSEDATEDNSENPMAALLDEEEFGLKPPRRGEIRTGTIARVTDSDIMVDIGYKSEGVIPEREFDQLTEEQREELKVGTEVTVYVLRTGGPSGIVLLSLSRAEEEKDWIEAEKLLESKEVFEGVISGYNKGGLIAKLGRIRGFVPSSQVSMSRRWRAEGDSPEERWGEMVGEPIVAKVIEVERKRNRLILSERAAAREARNVLKERLIKELQPGEVRKGHVISLADFGAFVDIGGADGLVHTSEISWKRISHPRDVLKVGQEVQVKVLSVDAQQKRISLSLREMEDDPWDTIVEQFTEGQLVEGSITKLTKFGAFASLMGASDYEVEGLIHISELSDRHIVHPREVVSEDEALTLRVIRVDRERRRIGLSLKRVDSPEYAERDWKAAMVEIQDEDSEQEGISPQAIQSDDAPESLAEAQQSEEGPPDEPADAQDVEGVEGQANEVDRLPEDTSTDEASAAQDKQDQLAAPDEEDESSDMHEAGQLSMEADDGDAPDSQPEHEQTTETGLQDETSIAEGVESDAPDSTEGSPAELEKVDGTAPDEDEPAQEQEDDGQEAEGTVVEIAADEEDINAGAASVDDSTNAESGEPEA